jgi:small GTP-binding protein
VGGMLRKQRDYSYDLDSMLSSTRSKDSKSQSCVCSVVEPLSFYVEDYQIVLLGSKAVGKTSLIYQFICDRFVSDYNIFNNDQSSIGMRRIGRTRRREQEEITSPASINSLPSSIQNICNKFRTQLCLEDGICHLELIDTKGMILNMDNMGLKDPLLKDADGYLILFDVTDRKTFSILTQILKQLKSMKKYRQSSAGNATIVIAANKCDLEEERQVQNEQIEALAKEWNVPWISLSVKLKTNLNETFHCIVSYIRSNKSKEEYIIPKKKGGCTIL